MKKSDEIKSLLNAYYEGRTGEEEEKRLYDFFHRTEVPQELSSDKELFLYLSSLKDNVKVPSDLKSRMSACIDRWEQTERVAPARCKNMQRHIFLRRCMGIAAGMLLVLSVGTYLYHTSRFQPFPEDTCASPEEAYAEAQKALLLFSHSLNKGLAQVEKAEETTDKVKRVVEKHFNNLKDQ